MSSEMNGLRLSAALLVLSVACGKSSGPEDDPIARALAKERADHPALKELCPDLDTWAACSDRRERAESQRRAEASRQALAAARLKVVSKPWPKTGPMGDITDQCRTKGKPPILRNYEGDQDASVSDQVAFAQAELVALADGCVHLFDAADPNTKEHAVLEYLRKSMFCCPK